MAEQEKQAADLPETLPESVGEGSKLAPRAGCLTFVFLSLAALTTWGISLYDPTIVTPWSWQRMVIVGVLVLVIPFIVFRTITLWRVGYRSRFPDIDYAWRAGVAAMEQHGISLRSAPIFITIGVTGDRERRNVMRAAGYSFRVDGVPDGPAPFHWYANPDAIFLVLNDVCWLHAATTIARRHRKQAPAAAQSPAAGQQDFTATLRPGEAAPAAAPTDEPRPPSGRAALVGTMMLPSGGAPGAESFAPTAAASGEEQRGPRLSSRKSQELLERLQHICGLVRQARNPVCPVNGMLVMLPFQVLQGSRGDLKELERAVAADISTAVGTLQLRCPITAVVTGMEQERGFHELIRRVGRDRAGRQRFGQRFDLRTEATEEALGKFAANVCGTFEDWVYALFSEQDALTKTGNTYLYGLLCKVRRSVQTRLGKVLGSGFGYDVDSGSGTRIFFSGCYFAATGAKDDRQAFMRGLLDKLRGEQEEIEWTEDALAEDRRRRWLARAGWATSVVLLAVLAGLIVYSQTT